MPVRSDSDPCDLHGAGLHLDNEEHHVADRPEHAQELDAEKVDAYLVTQWLLRNRFQVRLLVRFGAGSIPASASKFATVVRPISIFSPRSASRILV